MTKKKTFVLRINEETYVQIERWASDEFRSVNGQIEYIINDALRKVGRAKDQSSNVDENQSPTSA